MLRAPHCLVLALALVAGCNDGISVAVDRARGGDPALLCRAVCQRISTCEASPESEGAAACTTECVDDIELWAEPRRGAAASFLACEAQLSCPELQLLFTPGKAESSPCEAEQSALDATRPDSFIYFQF